MVFDGKFLAAEADAFIVIRGSSRRHDVDSCNEKKNARKKEGCGDHGVVWNDCANWSGRVDFSETALKFVSSKMEIRNDILYFFEGWEEIGVF